MLDAVIDKFSKEGVDFLKDHLIERGLSKREIEVVVLVLQGLTNKQVADKLCVAEKTVKFHLTNIYKRMKISRRSQIVWTLPLEGFLEKFKESKKANSISASQKNNEGISGSEEQEISIPKGHSTVVDIIGD